MKLLKKIGLIIIFHLILVQFIPAQKVWEKDWTNWKKEDAFKIINDSPWAKNYTNVEVSARYGSINPDIFSDEVRLLASPPVILRLYSSLRIRQALVRLRRIQDNYEQMNNTQKSEYDLKANSLLECENCKKFYVFILIQPVSQPNVKSVIGNEFKDEKLSNLTGKIFLTNDKKERRELKQFVAPKSFADAAVFYFPILDENQKSLITTETKKITVTFKHSLLEKPYLQDVQFDVSKMLIDGKLDF